MLPDRITAKFFIAEGVVDTADLVPIFHRWIRDASVPGLLIDVADYRHVPNGPAVLLIGHDGDYILDGADGRLGLLYRHKRDWPVDTLQERLALTLERVAHAVRLLENDPAFTGVRFRRGEIEITFPDRLNVPNTPAAFATLRDTSLGALGAFASSDAAHVARLDRDGRRPLTLRAVYSPAAVAV